VLPSNDGLLDLGGSLLSGEFPLQGATNAIQFIGGYGYTKDYPVERYFHHARLARIGEGTGEIRRLVIPRHLPGKLQ
jgi:alkylation response protein AidB-like acyl-CoA dehydrogenase